MIKRTVGWIIGSCATGTIALLLSVLPAPSAETLVLEDNGWQQLHLGPSSRFLTPNYQVTPEPIADPNPRARAYSAIIAGGGKLFWFGGGHNSYPGNDIETFEPAPLSWHQSYEPEVCPYVLSSPCYELYTGWGTSLTTPQGRPYVRHTYQAYSYDVSRNRLIALAAGTWGYDFALREWKAMAGPHAGGTFSPDGHAPGTESLLTYDNGLKAVQAVVTAGQRGVWILDGDTGRWARRGAPPENGWATLYSTYAPDRGLHYVLATSHWSHRWWSYDAVANRWMQLPEPPLVPDSFDYDTLNRVVVGVNHSNGFRVVVFDPDTGRWSALPTPSQGPALRQGMTGVPMAWRYVPSLNAFVFVDGLRGTASGSTTTWVYRYRNIGSIGVPGTLLTTAPTASTPSALPTPAPDSSTASPSPSRSLVSSQPVSTAPTPAPAGNRSFEQRCAIPGVVRCFGFDSQAQVAPHLTTGAVKPVVDTSVKASGAGSLRVPVHARPATSAAAFAMNFTPGSLNGALTGSYPVQFGEGQEFYVQWRQRFASSLLSTQYGGGIGWYQAVIGEGDRSGHSARLCSPLALAVANGYHRGLPQMFHACGAKDGRSEWLFDMVPRPGRTTVDYKLQNAIEGCLYSTAAVPPCVGYKANQWMTFQVHVKIGTWYRNDRRYHRDSLVELWVAEEGRPSRLVLSKQGYDLSNENPGAKYGKVWLTPHSVRSAPSGAAPVSYTWYDELIVSRSRILDPVADADTPPVLAPIAKDTTAPTVPQNLTATVTAERIQLAWQAARDNVGIASYRVTRDGIPIAETADLRYTVPNSTPGVRYVFTVAASDRAGNVSSPSSPVAATIPAPTVNRTLTIRHAGTGTGTTLGAAVYPIDTVVTMTATGTNGSKFAGWSGDGDCVDGVVTMVTDLTCMATFTAVTSATPPSPSPGSDTGAFQYGTVPATGYKRAGVSEARTYLFQPSIRSGERLSGTVTISVEARIPWTGTAMNPALVPHRLLVDGVPQPGFTIDTRRWPDGTHVLGVQILDPGGHDVGNGSKVVVFNNSTVPLTSTTGQAVVGGKTLNNIYNSLAWGRVNVRPSQPAPLSHNVVMHPEAMSDGDRQRLATERVWWVEQLTAPGTGLYLTTPVLVKNLHGDYFIQQWYPADNARSDVAVHKISREPALDGPRGIATLTGYTTLVRGLHALPSGHTGWLGVTIDGRVVDLDITGEVRTIFGPRSVPGVVQTDMEAEFTLAQRLAAGEKEFVGDVSGGTLWVAQDIWAREGAPDELWIADTGHDRIAVLNRTAQRITASIPLPDVSSVWGNAAGWWAVNPTGLYRITRGQATLVAPIPNAFWVRGDREGKVYVMTDSLAFYQHDVTTAITTLKKPAISPRQKFAFFDIDVDGVIGPRKRIYFGAVNLSLPNASLNASIGWMDPAGAWDHFNFSATNGIVNYQVYGSWMATSNPFGHYPWGFAIHRHIPKFVAAGIAAGWKIWGGHLGPLPNPDAPIPSSVNSVGTPLFRQGRLDEYLGLGAIFGSLGHGHLGYHVDTWRDLLTWPESKATMRAVLDPFFPAAMTESQRDAVTQMIWAQRTRKHFHPSHSSASMSH